MQPNVFIELYALNWFNDARFKNGSTTEVGHLRSTIVRAIPNQRAFVVFFLVLIVVLFFPLILHANLFGTLNVKQLCILSEHHFDCFGNIKRISVFFFFLVFCILI